MEWIFGAVGNIVKAHSNEDGETYYGTKAFKGGAKVYLNGKVWSSESDFIEVIGRNRFGRMIHEYVPVFLIENVREQRIYNPLILNIIENLSLFEGDVWWGRTAQDKKDAQAFVKVWNNKDSIDG